MIPLKFTLRGIQEAVEVVRRDEYLVSTGDSGEGGETVSGGMIQWERRKFQWYFLGLNISPYVFTRLTVWIARITRKEF